MNEIKRFCDDITKSAEALSYQYRIALKDEKNRGVWIAMIESNLRTINENMIELIRRTEALKGR